MLARTRSWLKIALAASAVAMVALLAAGIALYFAQKGASDLEVAQEAALLQESRAVSALARQESSKGDQLTSALLVLEVLPSPAFSGQRPVSADAAGVLRQAWLRNKETALAGHTGFVQAAAFSPDGQRVVTASEDNTARVWYLSGPRPVATVLEGHTAPVRAAAFSPDRQRVVTASMDNTARVWDLSGPRPVATVLEGHAEAVEIAGFSPDGQRVVTASDDNTARVWKTYPDVAELSSLVRAHLSRCLSVAQRERFGLAVADLTRPRDLIPPPAPDGSCPR